MRTTQARSGSTWIRQFPPPTSRGCEQHRRRHRTSLTITSPTRQVRLSAEVAVTVDELHDAITVIGELFVKYDSLLVDSGWSADALVPVIQHNWKAIFRGPWMRPFPERFHSNSRRREDGA